MRIIVGLGNPTKQYENTRHNIGFMLIDKLAKDYNIDVCSLQNKAIVGKGMIEGQKVILAKPQTYMNLSGESVRALTDYYKIDTENELIIISDDIDLPPGYIRVRIKGSAGGHNGLKNIIQHLGHDKFRRVRVGVGEKPKGMDLADYVLGHFPTCDQKAIEEGLASAEKAVIMLLNDECEEAMNSFNKKVSKPAKTDERAKADEKAKAEEKAKADGITE